MSGWVGEALVTADGVRVSVDVYREGKRDAAVIICPGFFQSKDTRTFRRLSEALAREQDVLAMDFRGHGESSGLYTFSAKEGADLEAVLEWGRARYRRLGVLAFSLGAAIAITTLSRNRAQVCGLMAVSAPASFEEIEFKWWTPEAMRTGVAGFEPGRGCRPGSLWLAKPRPIEHIARLSPMPVWLVHGTRDVIVGVAHSRRLYAAAAEPKRLHIIEGGSHAEALFRDDPARFTALATAWLRESLPSS
jgi:pimeloyl-ACP methyl ester carboxylesterase